MTASTIDAAIAAIRSLGVPDRDVAMYSTLTLKSPWMNLKWRHLCLQLGYENPQFATELWILCSRDPLFFLNTFAWLLETRKRQEWSTEERYGNSKEIPFITRGYQDRLVMEILPHLGVRDVVIPKSRETGVSWMIGAALAAWEWIFHEQTHIGFVSKDLLSANNPDDPDALFSKFEFLLKRLPFWILDERNYERNIQKNTFSNLLNGSSITAYAANADVARGGRKLWMLMDEFHFFKPGDDQAALDSTIHVTPSRIFVSTANRNRGMAGAFYDVVSSARERNGIEITIDWKDDPDKRRGLYHSEQIPGTDTYKLVIDDMAFWLEHATFDAQNSFRHPLKKGQMYPFIRDGRYRSLYYDHVWNRQGSTPQSVAAELDRDFGGATAQIFNPQLLARALKAVKPPVSHGSIQKRANKPDDWMLEPSLTPDTVNLWIDLKANNGKPPAGEYVFGADVSAGTGGEWSSYSALEGVNKETGEQVFEWRSNTLDPIQFAELAVWVCRLFHNAYLVPEINGPLGRLFINRVNTLKYPKVYRSIKQRVAFTEQTEKVGYINSDGGIELLKSMEEAIRTEKAAIHSTIVLNECSRYFMKNGKLVHSAAETTEDGAGMGLAHGDAAIAMGCAVFGMKDIPLQPAAQAPENVPLQSFLWRRQQWEAKNKAKRSLGFWDAESES
jgi:hypothetical protein